MSHDRNDQGDIGGNHVAATAQSTLQLSPAQIRQEVEDVLRSHLEERASGMDGEPPMPQELLRMMDAYVLKGGKRVRSLLCVAGWHAARGQGPVQPVIRVAASLEMFHASALLHDDVMDDSELRRGRPTAHRALARFHSGHPEADRLGVSATILLGDLALAWSDHLVNTAGLTSQQREAAGTVIDAMRTATAYGQYRDLTAAHQGTLRADEALFIARYKTARYTVETPLLLGAALAGADADVREQLRDFAVPLGVAFQLRDDLLGVYGDPEKTGKSRSEDIRDGKCTLLASIAVAAVAPDEAARLRELLGDRDLDAAGEAEARRLMEQSGARAAVEARISGLRDEALGVLRTASFPSAVVDDLRVLAQSVTARAA